jgi:hypothetical protein
VSSRLALSGGGFALVEGRSGERVTLLCTRAFPPGSTLTLGFPEKGDLSVKVRGSKKTEAGEFRVEGRAINLSRALRQALDEILDVKGTLPSP